MNYRVVSLFLLHSFFGVMCAMSFEEQIQFKKDLKEATTAQAVENIVRSKLLAEQSIGISPLGVCGADVSRDQSDDSNQKLGQVIHILHEVFFEDMHPFLFGGADTDTELAKFAKYSWANQNIVDELRPIFEMHAAKRLATDTAADLSDVSKSYNYIRQHCGKIMREDRILGGKEWFSRRLFGYEYARWGVKVSKYAGMSLCVLVLVSGLCYLCADKLTHADDAENSDSQQDNQNTISSENHDTNTQHA